jgi:hypothetical protein
LPGKEHSLALLAFVLKEYELWLVMKALVVNHSQVGAIFDAANMAIADCLVAAASSKRPIASAGASLLTRTTLPHLFGARSGG